MLAALQVSAALLLACCQTDADRTVLKSGPQRGRERLPGPFFTRHINGRFAGQLEQPICDIITKPRPMVMVFTRTVEDMQIDLIRKLDRLSTNSKAKRLVTVIVMSDDMAMSNRLIGIVKNDKIEAAVLSIWDSSKSPVAWNISEKADITIIVFDRRRTVIGNFAFAKGGLDRRTIDEVMKIFADAP